MKIKFLAVLGLAAVAGLAGCKGAANTNSNTAVVTNTSVSNTMTATPVVKTGESATVDPNMKAKIESTLKSKGFTDVTVDTSGGKMTLRGTVAKDKKAELMMVAMEANGGKPIENQVTEK